MHKNPAILSTFGFVGMDEIHIIHGDTHETPPSKYAYHEIAKRVLALQNGGDQIRFWGVSGTPAPSKPELERLLATLNARFSKRHMQTGKQGIAMMKVSLDTEYRTRLTDLRASYHECVREINDRLRKVGAALPEGHKLRRAAQEWRALHEDLREGRTIPSLSALMKVRTTLLHEFTPFTGRNKEESEDTLGIKWPLVETTSLLHEVRYILDLFTELRGKSRSSFEQKAAHKIAEVLYAAEKPQSFGYYAVRAHRREGLRKVTEWALASPTSRAIWEAFSTCYPGQHRPGSIVWSATQTDPPAWNEILSQREQAPFTIKALDEKLLSESTSTVALSPKERAILTFLKSIGDERAIIFCEEILNARIFDQVLRAEGLKSVWYAGKKAKNSQEIATNREMFISGEAQVLCGTTAAETGKDLPHVKHGIGTELFMSGKKIRQRMGRQAREKGQTGIYHVPVVVDLDPDFDERRGYMIALGNLKRLARVGEPPQG